MNLVILVGERGLAKSRTVRAVLGSHVCWIEGNATPFGMYEKLYRHRDQFVVIDDVDSLYADRSGIRLLKCLCQTEEEKTLAWHSDARRLDKHGIPREFATKSRVIIICNDWKTLNRNVAALQDRGHVLVFQPSAAEVHRHAGEWFQDPEIYTWFTQNLHRMREPSLRLYVRARELKAAGMDWTEVLAVEAENPRARLAAEILASSSFQSTAEKARAFVEQGGGCRATFFNYRRRLEGVHPPKSRAQTDSGATKPQAKAEAPPRGLPKRKEETLQAGRWGMPEAPPLTRAAQPCHSWASRSKWTENNGKAQLDHRSWFRTVNWSPRSAHRWAIRLDLQDFEARAWP